MQIISNIALITINETLFVVLISFLIFVVVLNRLMFRPLRQTMGEREQALETMQGAIHEAKLELETVSREAQTRESAIKQEAFKIGSDLEKKAKEEAATVLAASAREIDAIKAKNEQDVAKMITAAQKDLVQESERLTISIMEKLLDRRLSS